MRPPNRPAPALLQPRLLIGGLLVLLIGGGVYMATLDRPSYEPCPTGSPTLHPTTLHFEPGVVEHQNWAEIPPSEIQLGQVILLCTDGLLIGREHMEDDDLVARAVILRIPTRWVDVAWLSGKLDAYRDPTRWVVALLPFDPQQ